MESKSPDFEIKFKNHLRFLPFYIIFLLFLTPIFPQVWEFHGEGYVDPYYLWVFGDKNLFESQNSLYPGLNYQIKGRISFKQITELLSVSLNFTTGYTSQDQILLNLKSKNFEGIFSNNFQESLSYLTLWKKNVNGFELKYKNKNFSFKGLLAKVESTKKQKSFYGNNTSGPYFLSDFYLVAGKERIYLNGEILERDIDYIIDYSYGILYFSEIISPEDLILVEYEVRGIIPQIYNLLGLSLEYLPLSLTFLNIDDPSSQINRKFIDFSFLGRWEDNYLNLSLSQGVLENIFAGRAYNLNFNYRSKNINFNGETLKIEENYPYFKELLGNFDIVPGIFKNKLNISYTPFAPLTYNLNFLREDYINYYQNIKQNLSLNFSKISISGLLSNEIREKERDIKRLAINYKDIPLSFYIQENKEGDRRELLKGFSFYPQSSNTKININFQLKDTYTIDNLLLNQSNTSFYINIFSPNIHLLLGENYQENINFKPDLPLETTQSFITDGFQYEFTLTYTPLPESIKIYINNFYIENGRTFTYYLPSGDMITYTVEINLLDKTLQIFFVDESGKNPPLSGLNIFISYKYFLPNRSYLRRDEISLTLRWDKFNITPKGIILDDNGSIKRVFSLSLYGELIPKLWLNFSLSQYFEENKRNLSLNISYRPFPFDFSQLYIYQETPTSLLKNLSLSSRGKIFFLNLQGEYNFKESIYSNYLLRIRNFRISSNFDLFNGKISFSYFNEKRESNKSILSYISTSYSLSYNTSFWGMNWNYSLIKEDYSDLSFKWRNIIEVFPFKNNKSKIFLEGVYYKKDNSFYSFIRLGSYFSFIW